MAWIIQQRPAGGAVHWQSRVGTFQHLAIAHGAAARRAADVAGMGLLVFVKSAAARGRTSGGPGSRFDTKAWWSTTFGQDPRATARAVACRRRNPMAWKALAWLGVITPEAGPMRPSGGPSVRSNCTWCMNWPTPSGHACIPASSARRRTHHAAPALRLRRATCGPCPGAFAMR